jgi:hypothetical protein
MNHATIRLLALLLAVLISACSHAASSHHLHLSFGVGAVSLKDGAVVIKIEGRDQAQVKPDGRLRIGGADVPVTPQAQAALAQYNADAVAFNDQAMDLGVEGADFALHTIGQVFEGLFNGTADQAGRQAEQGSKIIETKARLLCQRIEHWRQMQDAAAAAAPQFRPYAVITADAGRDCLVDSKDHPAPKPDPAPQISS